MAFLMTAATALVCAQGAPVELRWSFEKGQELLYRSTQKQSFEIQGTAMDQTGGFLALIKITDVAADGTADVVLTYKGVRASAKGLLEFEYDSEKDKEPPAGAPQAAILARMIGKSLRMKMKPSGKIVGIQDHEKFVEELLAGEENEAMREAMKQMFSSDAMKSQMQGFFPVLSEKPVKPGDTWTDSFDYKLQIPVSMTFTSASTLKELKDGQATVVEDVKVDLKSDPDQAVPFEIKNAKGHGTSVFSVETGRLLSRTLTMEMTMTVAGNEMPMKTEQEMTLVEPKRDF